MSNSPIQMIQAFNDFKRNFTGNPEQEVRKLVSSGRINQRQLNQLQNMANEFQNMLNSFK